MITFDRKQAIVKKLLLILFFISFFSYSQCKIEKIQKDNYSYEGCLNYEAIPNGKGKKILVTKSGQKQTFIGVFVSGVFDYGEKSVIFPSGDISIINYEDYKNEIISKEIYEWSDGRKQTTIYNKGRKVKEITTYSQIDIQGLIVEKEFKIDGTTIETRNTNNNRVPEDILGNENYIDVNLIEEANQLRINIEFPTKSGDSFTVPIQFDSGATSFLIGNRLFQEIKNKCEIIDLKVEGLVKGVSGEFKIKYVKIKEIKIGDYLIKNVVVLVPLKDDMNDMLMGIGFLKKFIIFIK